MSTKATHPLRQLAASVGVIIAVRPRFMASPLAALSVAMSVVAWVLNSALRLNAEKFGAAIVINMTRMDSVTINSMSVNPL